MTTNLPYLQLFFQHPNTFCHSSYAQLDLPYVNHNTFYTSIMWMALRKAIVRGQSA